MSPSLHCGVLDIEIVCKVHQDYTGTRTLGDDMWFLSDLTLGVGLREKVCGVWGDLRVRTVSLQGTVKFLSVDWCQGNWWQSPVPGGVVWVLHRRHRICEPPRSRLDETRTLLRRSEESTRMVVLSDEGCQERRDHTKRFTDSPRLLGYVVSPTLWGWSVYRTREDSFRRGFSQTCSH